VDTPGRPKEPIVMAWHTLRTKDDYERGRVYVYYSSEPNSGLQIEYCGYAIDLTPSQRKQLAYLLLTGKPMPKSKEEAAYNLTKQYKEITSG
jgi:hypothetical protein